MASSPHFSGCGEELEATGFPASSELDPLYPAETEGVQMRLLLVENREMARVNQSSSLSFSFR